MGKQQPEVILPGHACMRSVEKGGREEDACMTQVTPKQSRKRSEREAEDAITLEGANN